MGIKVNNAKLLEALNGLDASLRQITEQKLTNEPVAVVSACNDSNTMSWLHEPALPVGTKLYTAPPQREWVGLTDEEILNLYAGITKSAWDCIMYARVIEARLKGMNHEPKQYKDLCGND